jgi:hypothetical protein
VDHDVVEPRLGERFDLLDVSRRVRVGDGAPLGDVLLRDLLAGLSEVDRRSEFRREIARERGVGPPLVGLLDGLVLTVGVGDG